MDLLFVKVMRLEMVMIYFAEYRSWVRGVVGGGVGLGREGVNVSIIEDV